MSCYIYIYIYIFPDHSLLCLSSAVFVLLYISKAPPPYFNPSKGTKMKAAETVQSRYRHAIHNGHTRQEALLASSSPSQSYTEHIPARRHKFSILRHLPLSPSHQEAPLASDSQVEPLLLHDLDDIFSEKQPNKSKRLFFCTRSRKCHDFPDGSYHPEQEDGRNREGRRHKSTSSIESTLSQFAEGWDVLT